MHSSDIKKELANTCPLLRSSFLKKPRNIWLTDSEYLIPSASNLEVALLKCSVSELKYTSALTECEEFALFALAALRQLHMKHPCPSYNWAFGMVSGKEADGGIHNMNICLTLTGLKLIEPQTNLISDFDINILNPFFIWM